MKDWRGVPIRVGSRVVYPGRHGSSLWMNEGEVVGIAAGELRVKRIQVSAYSIKPAVRRHNLSVPRLFVLGEQHD